MALSFFNKLSDSVADAFNSVASSPTAQRITLKFNQLNSRDQWAIRILVLFLIAVLAVFLVIMPAKSYANKAKVRYLGNKETVQWMVANKSVFADGSSSQVQARANQSLLSLASAAAQNYGMSFKRFEPVDETSLRLWLEDVNFVAVLQWIEMLDKTYNIVLTDVAVDQTVDSGLVNATVVLQE